MATNWYYARNKQKVGPLTFADLQRLVAASQLQPDDMLLQEGSPRWVAAITVNDLFQDRPSHFWSAALASGKWFLKECREVCRATFQQTCLPFLYLKRLWQGRRLRRDAINAQLALGRRLWELALGDSELRARITSLEEKINREEKTSRSARLLRDERQRLVLQLATAMSSESGFFAGIHEEMNHSQTAMKVLCDHVAATRELKTRLIPKRLGEWRRVGIGYGTVLAVVVLGLVLLSGGEPEGAVSDPTHMALNNDPQSSGNTPYAQAAMNHDAEVQKVKREIKAAQEMAAKAKAIPEKPEREAETRAAEKKAAAKSGREKELKQIGADHASEKPRARDETPAQASPSTPEQPELTVKLLLGVQQANYNQFGYKDVELGMTFEQVNSKWPLRWRNLFHNPSGYWSSEKGAGEFVFDANRRLVCYTKSYDGGADDYADKLAEVFGKSEQEIETWTTKAETSATRTTLIRYHFPKTLVRVGFVNQARAAVNTVQREEKTYVTVIDRDWVVRILNADATRRRKQIEWLIALSKVVGDGKLEAKSLPKLDGATIRENKGQRQRIQYTDDRAEEANEKVQENKGRKWPSVVVEVVRPSQFGSEKGQVFFYFNFGCYTPNKSLGVLHQEEMPAVPSREPRWHPFQATPISGFVTELTSALLQEYFPPKGKTIQEVRSSGFPSARYYEWTSKDSWRVRSYIDDGFGFINAFELRKVEEKNL